MRFRITTTTCLVLVVTAIVLTAHWPVLFTKALSFDDNQYLTENALVKNPSWNSASRFLSEVLRPSTVHGYYQPLTMISLMLDYARGGNQNNLNVFHQTSLALHLCNTVLVIILIFALFGRVWVALAAGLLFGLHPMTVETMVWIGERKTVLSAFFALLSLNFYVRYANKGGWKFYILTVLAYLLALMSKPTTTPLPILMLVLDYWPLRRFSKSAVIEKLPMLVIGGISGVITIISQANTSIVTLPGQYPPIAAPLMVCSSLIFYICKIFYPVHLSSHYPFPASFSLSEPIILTGVIGTIVLIIIVAISLRWTRVFLAGILLFLVGILPTMQIIGFSDVIASDKYAYLPAVGLLISGAYLAIWLWDHAAATRFVWPYRFIIGAAILFAAQREISATRAYIVHWQDTESLYSYMIELTPNIPSLHNNLGIIYHQRGKIDKAVDEWSKALAIDPNWVGALGNLALVLATDENWQKRDGRNAIEMAQKACQLTDYNDAVQLNTLATVYAQMGELEKANTLLHKVLTLRPDFANAHETLAVVFSKQGRFDEAINQLQVALDLNPDSAHLQRNLGETLLVQRKFREAVVHIKRALEIEPNDAGARNNLAWILAASPDPNMRKPADAIRNAQQACQLTDYKDASMLDTLSVAYASDGKFEEAITTARAALKIAPDQSQIKNDLEYHLTFYSQGKPYIDLGPKPAPNSSKF